MKPTIHLTNWASRKLHSGHVYTIMAKPRKWERGEGVVQALVPNRRDLDDVRAGSISVEEYEERFYAAYDDAALSLLRPGRLMAHTGSGLRAVEDGDTLCCACSRQAALEGKCHRAWSADLLMAAGWRVVLDGESMPEDGLESEER